MRQFILILIVFLLIVVTGGFLALGLYPLPLHQHPVQQTLPTSAIGAQ